MTLADVPIGKTAEISLVNGQGALRRRLLDMGLTPGTIVTVRKAAPMGDPIELELRGYSLSLRLEDAGDIDVSPVDFSSPNQTVPRRKGGHRYGR